MVTDYGLTSTLSLTAIGAKSQMKRHYCGTSPWSIRNSTICPIGCSTLDADKNQSLSYIANLRPKIHVILDIMGFKNSSSA